MMATFKSFEEIEAWQQARILATQVYEAVSHPRRRPRWSQNATTYHLPMIAFDTLRPPS